MRLAIATPLTSPWSVKVTKSQPVLPMTRFHKRSSLDFKLAVPTAFILGLLFGIPITYFLMQLPEFGWESTDNVAPPTTVTHAAMFTTRAPSKISKDISSVMVRVTARQPTPKNKYANLSRAVYNDRREIDNPPYRRINDSDEVTVPAPEITFHSLVSEGVLWSPFAERAVPKGFDDDDFRLWRRFLNGTEVLRLQDGCGKMQNRLLVLSEGVKSCARYRQNDDQIQGEIFSFYLGSLLGLRNVLPTALAIVDTKSRRWSRATPHVLLAQWKNQKAVVLTQYVENMGPAYIPRHFRPKTQKRLFPIEEDLTNLSRAEISELVQWSDLLLFDYLTANIDRVINNMHNEQWNEAMMSMPTHNLGKTPEGLLVFLDNESGLLHGYRLLDRYESYHRTLLDSLCIFRKDTVDAIDKLHKSKDLAKLLEQTFWNSDPGMADWLPFLPDRSIRTLKSRIGHVHQHIQNCVSRFSSDFDVKSR